MSTVYQTTRKRSFNIHRWSLKRDVLSISGTSETKLQQLQLYKNTIVVRESATAADWTTTIAVYGNQAVAAHFAGLVSRILVKNSMHKVEMMGIYY